MELKHTVNCAADSTDTLLIVPYGIETFFMAVSFFACFLLIVPYGIETCL